MTEAAQQPGAAGRTWIGAAARAVGSLAAAALDRLSWLAGPILDKELRVSARRRRNYVLRFVYLAALTVFAGYTWDYEVRFMGHTDPAAIAARMAVAGEHIAWGIIAFQFFVLPLVIVVMLSASAGEEIRQRTLATLMVTPVSGFRIALGKLMSKLVQVMLLLAISLPLLMLIRVMGGVDWQKVVAALVVTATTCAAVGALSLLLSTYIRRGYIAILVTLAIALGFCALTSFGSLSLAPPLGGWLAAELPVFVNPAVLVLERMRLMGTGVALVCGGINAALALGATAIMVAWAGRRLRKIGLGLAMVEAKSAARWERWMRPRARQRRTEADPIRRVTSSPVLWRERQVRFGLGRFAGLVLWSHLAAAVALVYILTIWIGFSAHEIGGMLVSTMAALLVATILLATVQSAPALAAEREAGTLTILLATPMDPQGIVWEKVLGAMWHSMPVWGLLLAHVTLAAVVGLLHPIAIVHVILLLAGVLALTTGIGMLVGSIARRSSTAVMLNLLVVGMIFVGLPLMLEVPHQLMGGPNLEGLFMCLHPVGQIIVAMQGATHYGGAHQALEYDWEGATGWTSWAGSTVLIALVAGAQICVGRAAGKLAVRRLRLV